MITISDITYTWKCKHTCFVYVAGGGEKDFGKGWITADIVNRSQMTTKIFFNDFHL